MIFENYFDLIKDDEHYNVFVRISETFEYVNKIQDIEMSIEYLISSNIIEDIKKLWSVFYRKKIKYIYSTITSLLKNLNSFIQSNKSSDSVIKKKKLLLANINFEYSAISYKEFNKILSISKEQREKENKKIALAIGGTDFNDSINANREINNIKKLSLNSNCLVVAVMACTVDVFKSFVKHYNFDYIHFAGHGTADGKLCFYKSNVKPSTIQNFFSNNQKKTGLLFLNNCYSKNFYSQLLLNIAFNYVTYDDSLNSLAAYNFSDTFYGYLFIKGNVANAFKLTQININDYHYLLL